MTPTFYTLCATQVDFSSLVLVGCATGLDGDGQVARFATSDMADLIAGVQVGPCSM